MKILVHLKKQKLKDFNRQLINQNEKFIKKDFDLDKTLMSLLNAIQEYFNQIGDSNNEGSVNQLKTYLNLAITGIDPIKLERVKSRRRDMLKISCFHCLSVLREILENCLNETQNTLLNASEMIQQIILSAYQSKLIDDTVINKINSIDDCALLWNKLKEHEQVILIDKKLKFEILEQDLNILLEEILSKLKN